MSVDTPRATVWWQDERLRTRAMIAITVVLVIAALRATEPVTLPLVLAVVLIAFTRPLYCWVEQRTWSWVAALVAALVVLLAAAVVAGAVALSIAQVAEQGPALTQRAIALGEQAQFWLQSRGLPVPTGGSGLISRVASVIGGALGATGSALQLLGITLAFFVLGILEVSAFRQKARQAFQPGTGDAVVDTTADVAQRVRQYLVAVTITSLIGGAAAGIFAFAVGLNGALTWALVTFLLNYIPTIGPFLSVIPPTLYAIVQGDGVDHVALVFLGLGAIQFVIGNFVDPKVAGKRLSLSPLVVIVAVTFWGWLWGVVGALLAVPITVALVAIGDRFERTRWLSTLLSEKAK